jgi:hypothetical protein
MQQKSGDHWRPLGFFSCKLTLLAAHTAITHFRHFCEGQAFQLWTDHKPLVTAISRVSAPISPRQQGHLALISEFNVQLLYLPGLKNVVADFFSCPNQTTSGSVAATSVADLVDFKEMATEQNCCLETQPLQGGTSSNWLSARQVLNAWLEMFPQAIFAQSSPSNSGKSFLIIFIMLLTPGGSPPVVLFHLGLCFAVFPETSLPGPTSVWPASGARSTATHGWFPNPSPSPNGVFLTSMLIWWAHT